ncbi:sugar ABC transporter permease [Phytohabitans sp. ZYX-F-186]|uniref:Sugar ABC transporter permease n=1 Tax=Phytohabitans maris TaxID=3071409 RepID=A0ABU0ZKM3_9ACTN|nr:sugar ABC transporter permease [Phytohabitans sp. ZYX-F-186]MDQ7907538.1 sugar ABC transporter permease [Phytohabitans sp. ZYX-F-186]
MALVLGVFAVVFAGILVTVGRLETRGRAVAPILLTGPALLLLGVGLVYPAIRTIVASFFDAQTQHFVGMANYSTLVNDPSMRRVIVNTMLWIVICPIVSTVIGMVYAVLADRVRWEVLAKTLVFLPMAISFVGAAIIWKFVYEYRANQPDIAQIGLLNQIIVWLGGDPQHFVTREPWNTLFLMVVMIWIEAGFAMTVVSAAIKGVPSETIEASRLDGCGALQTFLHITLPSIRAALVLVLTAITIAVLKVFDVVLTMTGGQFNTSVIANEYYAQTFRFFNVGVGSALATVLFLFVIPIVVYNVRQYRRADA